MILLVLPALMVAFGYYHSHRPAVNPVGSRTFWDYIILNSDILLGLLSCWRPPSPSYWYSIRRSPRPVSWCLSR